MKELQKVIKYVAIAFGLFLSLNIIGAIIFGGIAILGIGTGVEYIISNNEKIINFSEEFSGVENLEIEVSISKINIKTGEKLKIEGIGVTSDFKAVMEEETLKLQDKKIYKHLYQENNYPEITIYLPENITFNKVKISTGLSETNIEDLETRSLELELGVGNTIINHIEAKNSKIETGAGNVTISDAILKDTKIEAGVGNFVYSGDITGDCELECGIGKTQMNLNSQKEEHKIKIETGIGVVYINGEKVEQNRMDGDVSSTINIEAGIGRVDLNFKQ